MLIPHNPVIEHSLIAAFIAKPKAARQFLDRLTEEHFHGASNKRLWAGIVMSFARHGHARPNALADVMAEQGTLDLAGGLTHLMGMSMESIAVENIESYVQIVEVDTKARALLRLGSTINIVGADREGLDQAVDDLRKELDRIKGIGANLSTFKSISECLPEAIQRLANACETPPGIPIGYPEVDLLLGGGLKPGHMVVLAARPSIGKTAIAVNAAVNMAMSHRLPIAVFSLEMSREELVERILFSEARVDFNRGEGYSRSQLTQIAATAERLAGCPVYIDDAPGQRLSDVRAKAHELARVKGLGVIVIDYLQIMRGDGRHGTREQEIASISRGLKHLAKELNVPVLVLAQLNRTAEGNERPRLSHLRESGQIEQDADVIMFLHRDRRAQQGLAEGDAVSTELIVEKNRSGACGIRLLSFVASQCRFDSGSMASYGEPL